MLECVLAHVRTLVTNVERMAVEDVHYLKLRKQEPYGTTCSSQATRNTNGDLHGDGVCRRAVVHQA